MIHLGGFVKLGKMTNFRPTFHRTFAVALLCAYATTAIAEQTVLLKVKGIKDEALSDNVRIFLSQIDNAQADGSEYYQYTVRNTIIKALRALGYFGTEVNFRLEKRQAPAKSLLFADVKLDKPVLLEKPNVQIAGEATEDADFEKLLTELPKAGTVLNQGKYDDFKSSLQTLATAKGYFDGEYTTSRLLVMPDEHRSLWDLVYSSGQRYHFGQVTFDDSQIDERLMRNLVPSSVQEGEPYSIYAMSSLTTNYNDSNWFRSVLVSPQLLPDKHAVDLNVQLQPKKKNQVDIGIGYSTDVGPRFQLGWDKPWINRWGHSISSDLYVSAPEQTLEFIYKVPVISNPLRYYYEYALGFENIDDNDTESTSATLSGMRYWNNEKGWQYSFGLKARYDNFTQADENYKTFLLYPSGGFSRTRMRGGLFPTWGDKQSITFDLGRKWWLSDVDFFRVVASSAWIRTYATNHRIVTRASIGFLDTSQFSHMPPALRFFAGGDRSVRGYGYNDISPTNSDGDLIGGSRLLTGSFEYQYQVYPNWWGAVFTDTGLAAYSYSTDNLKYGAGFGVRWASPIGAVKFDLATPIADDDGSHNVEFYIGIGSEL